MMHPVGSATWHCCDSASQLEEEIEEAEKDRVLPESCWLQILEQLPVREVCMLARVNRWGWEGRHVCILTAQGTARIW